MIEAQTAGELSTQTQATSTPERITTSMIIEDLENGIDREGIRTKYNLEKWEVSQMFKHPALKGKKVKKTRKLSFNFVDDTTTVDPAQTSIPVEHPTLTEAADMLYGVDNEQTPTLTQDSVSENQDGQTDDYNSLI